MEEARQQIEELLEKAVDYGKTTIELTKLKAIDKVADIGGSIFSKIALAAALFFFFLFASLGLAFWFGDILGKTYLGFFAVAAIYLVLGILIHLLLNKWIKKLICNYIIRRALN